MFVDCPSCGSKHVRHSRRLSIPERIISLFGYHTLRCNDCKHRFRQKVWHLRDWIWSRCPRCYRTDLSTWSEEHYSPKTRTLIKLRLGAKRLRCEYCRFNFAGFRPVKERYKFRRRSRGGEAPQAEPMAGELSNEHVTVDDE
ncbi:MAG: hypothetical protein JNK87_00495 [Bryobacterales bacterium]|nr:hypothetical protein [Bryobacterales bacterium]